MIAVVLPINAALAAELALTGEGALPAGDLHVTLAMIDSDHPDVAAKVAKLVSNIARNYAAVTATLSGLGRFAGNDRDPFYLSVDSPGLHDLLDSVRMEMRWGGVPVRQEHGFDPHVTLAYLAKDAKAPLDRFEQRFTRFDSIAVWHGAERTAFSLQALLDAKGAKASKPAAVATLDAQSITGIPKELRLFKDGWNDTVKGQFLVDAESAKSCLASFADHGVELAMDFDHGTYAAGGTKKDIPGYIGGLEYRPNDGLYAVNVRWTEVGLRAIQPGKGPDGQSTLPEYRYFSPAVRFDAESRRITSIEPVAIVTFPATKNQPPLVMSAAGTALHKKESRMNPQLLIALSLPSTAAEGEVLVAINKLNDELKSAQNKANERDAMLSAITADRDAKAKRLDEIAGERDAKAKELAELSAKLEASARAALLDQGRRENKLTPALEKLFATESPEKIRAFLEAAPVVNPLANAVKPPSEGGPSEGVQSQLAAIVMKPYEKWDNNERAFMREHSFEIFSAKRRDAEQRGAL